MNTSHNFGIYYRNDFSIVSRDGRLLLQVPKGLVFRQSRPFVLSKIIMEMNYYDCVLEESADPVWTAVFILSMIFIMWLARADENRN